jgi:hypothetical protein
MSTDSYYFLPHIGLEQKPTSLFNWGSGKDHQQKCNDATDQCAGYSTDGKSFDMTILNPDGFKVRVYDEPERGSYFKHKSLFEMACGYMKGTPEGQRCNLDLATAKNTINDLKQRGKVEEAFVSSRRSDRQDAWFLLIVLFLVMLIRCS